MAFVHDFVQLNRVVNAVNQHDLLSVEELADPMDVRNGIVPFKEILEIEISNYGTVFVLLSDEKDVAAASDDYVFIGSEFTILSSYERLAAIFHEIGHCLLHMDNLTPVERLLTKEIEADAFAAFTLGKLLGDYYQGFTLMIQTLEHLIAVYGFDCELQNRIHALRNIMLGDYGRYIH